ncbi:MAG: T9SS C-terminal target domain-containing protein, partial [Gemmatimonadota bacterium]|nr:T9SS C-terminal target domain-containing protein [Gemmatimonadota bacterium]
MKKLLPVILLSVFAAGSLLAQSKPERTITDADIIGDITLSADTVYILSGFVFVGDGESLTIPAGTIIKGMPGQGVNASALIVARGGKIYANGSAVAPIIFTAQADNVDDAGDLPLDARGLWGGVIILGKAGINTADSEGL